MRILVCGSRTWSDGEALKSLVWGAFAIQRQDDDEANIVIHGGAPGADSFAAELADESPVVDAEEYPARWEEHGKAAGPIRNQEMIEIGKPDLVLAFIDKPLKDSRGTADMIRRAYNAAIPAFVIESFRRVPAHQEGVKQR